LHAAIARLPDAQREAFVLRHVEDMPSADVARVLDLPEGSVRRLVYEAREQLQWMLNAERVRERTR
jgi:RNA polymerase sigma-70 factor (ECF subfamily)